MKIEPILFAKQLLDYLRGNLSGQAAEQDVLETLAEHRLLGQVAEELQDKTFISH